MTKIDKKIRKPAAEIKPVDVADTYGFMHTRALSKEHQSKCGIFLTPPEIARYMASMLTQTGGRLSVLDPAAGAGILLCAIVEEVISKPNPPSMIHLTAYEVDRELIQVLKKSILNLKKWAKGKGVSVKSRIWNKDFLENKTRTQYDVVISNPPYFKMSKNDPRALSMQEIVGGQPNIYSFFMVKAAQMLKSGGEYIFLTPRSFTAGKYFTKTREKLFSLIRPEHMHLFLSRSHMFERDQVLQENVITKGSRQNSWIDSNIEHLILITSSAEMTDLNNKERLLLKVEEVINIHTADKIVHLPISQADRQNITKIKQYQTSLKELGYKVSTGRVVPFRSKQFMALYGNISTTHSPLLWMSNITSMKLVWPMEGKKPQYIKNTAASKSRLIENKNYVLLRRFSPQESGERLVVVPYLKTLKSSSIGLENHLNYIYKEKGDMKPEEVFGLTAYLSSDLVNTYFRVTNGNTQISAFELLNLPIPSQKELLEMGRHLKKMVS